MITAVTQRTVAKIFKNRGVCRNSVLDAVESKIVCGS